MSLRAAAAVASSASSSSSSSASASSSSTSTNDLQKILSRLPKREFIRVKVLSCGDACSGKTCLIKRYCEGKVFVPQYSPTIGVDFGAKPIEISGEEVRVNFWDLSGRSEYLDIRNEFYKDTHVMLLVYDVSKRPTFDSLTSWMEEATSFQLGDAIVVVVGNKVDLKDQRVVSKEEGSSWAKKHGFLFFESSARSGDGVAEIFETVIPLAATLSKKARNL